MQILLLEPFYTGSHKQWVDGLVAHSEHQVETLTLSGHHWKWRMHGGAVTLARKFLDSNLKPDLILATDMLDLNVFLSLTRHRTADVPAAIYFHENQLVYPWSPDDADVALKRDNHYSFINYASALTADRLFFNSQYHLTSFFAALPAFLKAFPDHQEIDLVEKLRNKAAVLPLGLDLQSLQNLKPEKIERPNRAVLLWNHRWEYDKNPKLFFNSLYTLEEHGIDFRLVILGEQYEKAPPEFVKAREHFGDKILHYGYAESRKDYAYWLYHADILPVTSMHDFFGVSVVEAIACDVTPLLPLRLAYPEHLPTKYQEAFFYKDERDFLKKLQRRIMDVRVLRPQRTAHFVEKYDWEQLQPIYDKKLAEVSH